MAESLQVKNRYPEPLSSGKLSTGNKNADLEPSASLSSFSESSYYRDRPRWRHKAKPGPGAPRIDPDLERLYEPHSELQITWLGHASFLIQLANCNVLIDPILSHRRVGLRKRHVPPGLEIEQLPEVHGLLITHGHRDHLDEWTVSRLPRGIQVFVPRGLSSFFTRKGFERTTELEWWQTAELDGCPQDHKSGSTGNLAVTLTPARHETSPSTVLFERNAQCGGFVIEDSHHAIYHAGDTAFFDGFAEVGRKFPALDAALLPVGAYRRESREGLRQLLPEEAGQGFLQTGAKRLIPMHWGTFQLADEPLREGPDRLRTWWSGASLGSDRELVELAVGQTLGWD